MGGQIAQLLIETLFGVLIYVLLLRFWMQALRAPFRNPIGQFVVALTDWAVAPMRRVIPSFRSYDLATFLLAWLAQILMTIVLYVAVAGGKVPVPGIVVFDSLLALFRASLILLMFVVIVQVILSWVNPYMPLAPVFDSLTRPFYGFFRRFIPPIGNVDLSPLFVVVIAQVMLIVLDGVPRALLTSG